MYTVRITYTLYEYVLVQYEDVRRAKESAIGKGICKAHSELVQEVLHAALVLGDEAVHARQVRLVRAELEQVAQMHQDVRYQLQCALRVLAWSLCGNSHFLHVKHIHTHTYD